MKGQRVGYIRVSTVEQNIERQLDDVSLDRVFVDKVSGKDKNRPQLKAMLEFVREGDIVLVHSMDRIARNLEDLRSIVQSLTSKGIEVTFVKENLTFYGEDKPLSLLFLSIMGAFAEFERALILERQREGIALAKARNAYKGRKPCMNQEQIEKLHSLLKAGIQKTKLAKQFGISRDTLYKYLRKDSYKKSTMSKT